MPRPPGTLLPRVVDAAKCAQAGLELAREFTLQVLPRLQAAGAGAHTALALRMRLLRVAQRTAIDGTLSGSIELTCQRCLGYMRVPVQESFKVIIVTDEAALTQEFEQYEPIIADPGKLDLGWLAEEQALLAMPLVARHEPGECQQQLPKAEDQAAEDEAGTQHPFGNLRDMLRGRS